MVNESNRIFGLDLLRALAVLFVIFHHSLLYVRPWPWLYAFGPLGTLGVEFLLVLTGYLIGHSLLKEIRQGRFGEFQLKRFYTRRWLRTLPPYYFFLVIMAALTSCTLNGLWSNRAYFF